MSFLHSKDTPRKKKARQEEPGQGSLFAPPKEPAPEPREEPVPASYAAPPLYGLSLWQPWAWAVATGQKVIENRPWAPTSALLRKRPWVAIHAAKTFDKEGALFLRERGLSWKDEDIIHGAVIGICKIKEIVEESDDPMFFGPYGWVLEEIREVPPLPCRGMQGLFPLPEEVMLKLLPYLEARVVVRVSLPAPAPAPEEAPLHSRDQVELGAEARETFERYETPPARPAQAKGWAYPERQVGLAAELHARRELVRTTEERKALRQEVDNAARGGLLSAEEVIGLIYAAWHHGPQGPELPSPEEEERARTLFWLAFCSELVARVSAGLGLPVPAPSLPLEEKIPDSPLAAKLKASYQTAWSQAQEPEDISAVVMLFEAFVARAVLAEERGEEQGEDFAVCPDCTILLDLHAARRHPCPRAQEEREAVLDALAEEGQNERRES